jgi:hypothetical protein
MRDSEIEQWVINEIRLLTGSRLRELWRIDRQSLLT